MFAHGYPLGPGWVHFQPDRPCVAKPRTAVESVKR